jgi:hypothetical protein
MPRWVAALVLAGVLAGCSAAPSASPSLAATANPTVAPTVSPTATPTEAPTPSPEPTTGGVAARLAEAVETTIAKGTVTMDFVMAFEGSTLIPDGTDTTGNGVLAFGDARQAAIEGDMTELGAGTIAMIIDEPDLWLRFGGPTAVRLGTEGKWIFVGPDATSPMAASLRGAMSGPNDSTLLLYYLLGAGDDAAEAGTLTIDGVETTKVTATLELEAALDRVPAKVRDALLVNIVEVQKQSIEPILDSETWIDDAGLVRRLRLVYTLSSAQGGGTMSALIDFSKHGARLDLGIPTGADVIDVDDLVLPGS